MAKRLGVSEAAARVTTFRMRRRLRTILREEVARTVTDGSQVDPELRHLFAVLGR